MTSRPRVIVAVVGVATEVGKTWIASALLTRLVSGGLRVSARKPVQSYEPDAVTTDAQLLAAATGEDPTEVCPMHRWYPLAMAPPMAAARLGRARIALDDLLDELAWPADADVGVVETVGGVRSPMTDDADSATFVRAVKADHVVLVADASLGAINAVRLCAGALESRGLTIVLNRFSSDDAVHEANRTWLVEHDGFCVVTSVDECVATVLRATSFGDSDPGGRLRA